MSMVQAVAVGEASRPMPNHRADVAHRHTERGVSRKMPRGKSSQSSRLQICGDLGDRGGQVTTARDKGKSPADPALLGPPGVGAVISGTEGKYQ
jgi:hypothetical protein